MPSKATQQDAGDPTGCINYHPAGSRLDQHLAGIDAALGAIAPAAATSASMGLHARSVGATKTTSVADGNVLAEEFDVGDELYLEWHIPDDIDRTQDAVLHLHWYASTAGEVNKKVSWRFTILSSAVGDIITGTTGTINATDQPYSSTQYQSVETAIPLAAATYFVDAKDAIQIKLARVASSNDPVGNPRVIHAHIGYHRA